MSKGTLAERGHDLYETPPEAILALLAAEDVPAVVWEPACGRGAMARVLRASGRHVVATDLVDYATPDQDAARVDFLLETAAPAGVQCHRDESAVQARGRVRGPCDPARAARLPAPAAAVPREREQDEPARGRPPGVRAPLPRTPADDAPGRLPGRRIISSALPFAWFIWDREHRGDPAIRRWQRPVEPGLTTPRRPSRSPRRRILAKLSSLMRRCTRLLTSSSHVVWLAFGSILAEMVRS